MAMAAMVNVAPCMPSATRLASGAQAAAASNSAAVKFSLSSSLWGTKPLRVCKKRPQIRLPASSFRLSTVAILLDEPEESPEETEAAYRALYGPAFSGIGKPDREKDSGQDDDEDGGGRRGRRGRGGDDDRERGGRGRRGPKEFEERVVQIRRVTKVVKGGKQLSFRAVVVIGDKKGRVGVGVGKAKEVIAAVQKSATDAKRHLITVPMTKYLTFPHRAEGNYGAAKVMLRPAAIGTGVIAGGSVRVVLELAGVENALGKEIGSKNPLNNARAVIEAVSGMKQFREVARDRGIPMEELWK
eukprot:TRINITY_DN15541_c0_g2_i1.p1 TRINITY_DN15541_c0_g2~~TRINITY_DN15541_c0_g2_i1.p1  ORF type:complete len:321 (+),score=66.09 TRINITY_DN15541_c0_g2_i1:64-963(+)